MELVSDAFSAGARIPARYTCEGENVSPPLEWRAVPRGTESLALICDDPDTPGASFLTGCSMISRRTGASYARAWSAGGGLSWGGMQGRNDAGDVGYRGPCPPTGETHNYYWRLYTLDAPCELPPGATRAQLLDWIHEHELGGAELMGRFGKS